MKNENNKICLLINLQENPFLALKGLNFQKSKFDRGNREAICDWQVFYLGGSSRHRGGFLVSL